MAISSLNNKSSSRKLSRISYGAYFLGGSTAPAAKTTIDKLTFSNLTGSTLSAVLSTQNYSGASVANNNQAGYHLGGANNAGTRTAAIDKLSFPYETLTTLSATLATASMYRTGGASNHGTAGYIFGGNDATSDLSSIQKLLYSTEARSTLSATLSRETRRGCSIGDSGNAGYKMGGYANAIPGGSSRIEKLPFSTESISTLGATLSSAVFDISAVSNTGSSIYIFSWLSVIEKLSVSTDTRSTLGTSRFFSNNNYTGAVSDGGVAGYVGKGYGVIYANTVERFPFSTETIVLLNTTLSVPSSNPGAVANSARV